MTWWKPIILGDDAGNQIGKPPKNQPVSPSQEPEIEESKKE